MGKDSLACEEVLVQDHACCRKLGSLNATYFEIENDAYIIRIKIRVHQDHYTQGSKKGQTRNPCLHKQGRPTYPI